MLRDRRRSRRRRAGGPSRIRLAATVVGAAVATVFVVGSIASIGPASVPFQRTLARGFAELATPIGHSSNATGAALAATLSTTSSTTRTALFAALDQAADDAAAEASEIASAGSPPAADGSSDGCVTSLADRAEGAADVRDAVEGLLGGPTATGATADDQPTALRLLTAAGAWFVHSDALWAGCREALRLRARLARLPASLWVVDPAFWDTAALQGFVGGLVGLPGLAPAPHLAIVALTSAPLAIASPGLPGVLPPTSSLVVTVVVSNRGNVAESGVRVEAAASAVGDGSAPGHRVVRRVDIAAGQSLAVTLPAISVAPGRTYAIVVTALDVAGGSSPTSTLTVSVATLPPATTTTTPPTSSPTTTAAAA